MKTRLILLLLFAFLIPPEDLSAQQLEYGLQGGMVFAKTMASLNPDMDLYDFTHPPITSYALNGYLGIGLGKSWTLSIEPGYIQKGGLSEIPDVEAKFNYIHVPVLADFQLTGRFSVVVGPEVAYLINSKGVTRHGPEYVSERVDTDFEFSGILGLTYGLNTKFDVGIRYNRGFTPVFRTEISSKTGEHLTEMKTYNKYFQVFLRVRF